MAKRVNIRCVLVKVRLRSGKKSNLKIELSASKGTFSDATSHGDSNDGLILIAHDVEISKVVSENLTLLVFSVFFRHKLNKY